MNHLIAGPPTVANRLRRSVDWVIVVLTIGLVTLGLLNLNSAEGGDWTGDLVRDQFRFALIGAVGMAAAAAIDYRVYYRTAYPIYGVAVGFLGLVIVVGITVNQATRWLDIAFVRFQPSELMKLAIVIGLARFLHDLKPHRRKSIRGLPVPAAMTLFPAAFVIAQPDLSTSIMLILIAMSVFAGTELRVRSLLGLMAIACIAFAIAWSSFLEDYQIGRIDVWLDPEGHPEKAYQILQARTAVGSGGFLGRGSVQGTQNRLGFVPYKESDFSFAVFAEEWGFVGSVTLLALFLSLVIWAINLASQARDRFGAVLCIGVAAMVFWHVVLNIGVVLEFFPNTGLPLPFFSHGGSNVVTMMLALGVLMSVSRSRHRRA